MSVWAGIRRFLQPSESDLGGQIEWAVKSRELGLSDYLGIPAVSRGRQLIISLVSELEPVAIANGYALDPQPAVLRRPAPEITRQAWLAELVASLVDHGNAALWIPATSRDANGRPEQAIVLPWSDVSPEWADGSHVSRRYRWRDRTLYPGRDVIHIAIGRQAGELEGVSPLRSIEGSLARILAAELFAGDWFDTGAVPSVVLKYDGKLTDADAADVKAKWIANHADHSPAVLPAGWDLKDGIGSDPQGSQLLETRKWGALEVARGLGIFPAELLLAELGGSSLTYQNVADALMTFARVTLQPVYMAAIEEGLSDLVPSTQAVRLNTSELERLGTAQRWAAEAAAKSAGMITQEQIDRWEGWDRSRPEPIPAPLAPTPAPTAAPAAVGG